MQLWVLLRGLKYGAAQKMKQKTKKVMNINSQRILDDSPASTSNGKVCESYVSGDLYSILYQTAAVHLRPFQLVLNAAARPSGCKEEEM